MNSQEQWYWIGFGSVLTCLCLVALFCLGRFFMDYFHDEINAFGNRGRSRKIKNVEMAVADETAMDAEPPRSSTESSPSYYQESSEFREQTYSSSRFKRKLSPLSKEKELPEWDGQDGDILHGRLSRKRTFYRLQLEETNIRSVSRMLWEDLALSSAKENVIKTTSKRSVLSRHQLRSASSCQVQPTSASRPRISWGNNCVKIQLFAKLASGYFSVDSIGRLCKVNDWKHVSDTDLHYREQAIYEMACNNMIEVERQPIDHENETYCQSKDRVENLVQDRKAVTVAISTCSRCNTYIV